MKSVLSNMGFVMQIAGIFIIVPIIVSFILRETSASLALFITSIAFLILGFVLNALCERKELSFKASCALIVLVFIFLSLIGAIPYFYLNLFQGSLWNRLSNSFFEAASGYTTTGFSVISNLELIPKSIILYRALTQFIGGIGIVLILLIFFYPEEKLRNFSKSLGLSESNKIKKTFFIILLTYCFYSIVLSVLMFLLGGRNVINSLSFIFSALSTGGFSPVNNIPFATSAQIYILLAGMLIGASNFIILARLVKFKIKEFFTSEISVFLFIAIILVYSIKSFFNLPLFDSAFHTISAMSTTGFSYIDISALQENLKILFAVLMFIGGASFSTAGGIKIYRFLLIFKALGNTIRTSITGQETKSFLFGREYSNSDIVNALVTILFYLILTSISVYIFFNSGFGLVNSIFEVTSAITTTGLSVGIVSASLALNLKWLIVALMILGRVEILAFFIMLSPFRK